MAIECLYGDTVSGKTTAIELLASWFWKEKGLKTRVWIGDGGEESYNRSGLVDEGVIEIMDFSRFESPMTVLKMIADGYFLKDPKDPGSRLTAPAANHHEVYGLHVYEGGTVIGQWLMSDVPGGMAWHAATGSGFGGVKDEDGNLSVKDVMTGVDANYTLQGATSGKHFATVQRKILNAIRVSKQFPGMTIWTAHPTEAPDKTEGGVSGQYGAITGKKVIGPDFGGKAPASLIGKEFGNLLHFDSVTKQKKELDRVSNKQVIVVERDFRLYTRRHYDPNSQVSTEYVAGNRCALPSMMPDYLTSKDPGDSILQFYGLMKKAREAVIANKAAAPK